MDVYTLACTHTHTSLSLSFSLTHKHKPCSLRSPDLTAAVAYYDAAGSDDAIAIDVAATDPAPAVMQLNRLSAALYHFLPPLLLLLLLALPPEEQASLPAPKNFCVMTCGSA